MDLVQNPSRFDVFSQKIGTNNKQQKLVKYVRFDLMSHTTQDLGLRRS
jgi:hypothetical protein